MSQFIPNEVKIQRSNSISTVPIKHVRYTELRSFICVRDLHPPLAIILRTESANRRDATLSKFRDTYIISRSASTLRMHAPLFVHSLHSVYVSFHVLDPRIMR